MQLFTEGNEGNKGIGAADTEVAPERETVTKG